VDNYKIIGGKNCMSKKLMFVLASSFLLLSACTEKGGIEPGVVLNSESENLIKDEDNKVDEYTIGKKEDTEDKEEVTSGVNLFDKPKVFKFLEDDVVMTLEKAEFTKKFETSKSDGSTQSDRVAIADSETMFRISGTVVNDTLNTFHYGHNLAYVKFKLVYDGKHEFDLTGATESIDGTEFTGASVDSLQNSLINIYSKVPLPVSETDKSLVLLVITEDGELEIPLR
jgi:hypothetical protein